MHSKIVRFTKAFVVLAFCAAMIAPAPAALAYLKCSDTITVYASGGQTCERTCHFYDNETGNYQGSMSREYRC